MKLAAAALVVATSTAPPPTSLEVRLFDALQTCGEAVDVCEAELAVARSTPPPVEVREVERIPDWAVGLAGVLVVVGFVGGVYVGANIPGR